MGKKVDTKGVIFKIKRFSVHDGPGIRTAIFLKGCPLSCIWCHSPEGISSQITVWYDRNKCIACGLCVDICPTRSLSLSDDRTKSSVNIDRSLCQNTGNCIDICPTGALSNTGFEISANDVVHEIEKDFVFFMKSGGGVTLTGGEPLFQPDFSSAILAACRKKKIHTAIETCLYSERCYLERITSFCDLVIADIKLFDSELHYQYTGKNNEIIKDNLIFLASSGVDIIVRVPMIEDLTATKCNLFNIEKFVRAIDKNIPVEYIKYNPLAKNNYEKLGMMYYRK